MNTISDIAHIKGIEYLIAIAFLFAFVAYWQFVHHRGKGLAIRVIPLLVVTVGLGALASTCVINGDEKVEASVNGETTLLSSPVLIDMYGPAQFDHDAHVARTDGCAVCHHHALGEITPCSECHSEAFQPDNLNMPGIAHIFHLRCISCHEENQAGPVDCTGCHSQASVPPLSITHPLNQAQNCLACHGDSLSGVPELPADHSGATNDVCQLCHQLAVEETFQAINSLPHPVDGREDCLLCHAEGIGSATKVPDDHAGRTNDTCLLCHK